MPPGLFADQAIVPIATCRQAVLDETIRRRTADQHKTGAKKVQGVPEDYFAF